MQIALLQAVAAGAPVKQPLAACDARIPPHATLLLRRCAPGCGCKLAWPAAGLGFTCVEHLLTIGPAGSYLTSLFKSNEALPASQIRPAVHQAATNIVGMLHVFIVVSLHISHWMQSQYATLQQSL